MATSPTIATGKMTPRLDPKSRLAKAARPARVRNLCADGQGNPGARPRGAAAIRSRPRDHGRVAVVGGDVRKEEDNIPRRDDVEIKPHPKRPPSAPSGRRRVRQQGLEYREGQDHSRRIQAGPANEVRASDTAWFSGPAPRISTCTYRGPRSLPSRSSGLAFSYRYDLLEALAPDGPGSRHEKGRAPEGPPLAASRFAVLSPGSPGAGRRASGAR